MEEIAPATLDSLAKRVKWARQQRRMTQVALAETANVAQSDVSKIERGDTLKTANLLALARALKCDADWLDTGDGSWLARPPLFAGEGAAPDHNVAHIPGRGAVPMISWVQAGSWNDVSDPFQPGVADEWYTCPVKHGPKTYCLKVRGDSMHNPDERPSYSDGDIIFVDPDLNVAHKDRAIVRLEDDQQVTFKQYMEEGDRRYLKALNPDWKPRYIEIDSNATFCGKVIGKWVPE